MNYTTVRTSRKTISIKILPDGTAEVRAPRRTPAAVIDRVVQEKADWIRRTQKKLLAARAEAEDAVPSGTLPYLGTPCPVCPGDRPAFRDGTWYLRPGRYREDGEALLASLAKAYILSQVDELAMRHGFSYTSVHITSAKTRFGSCSGKNSLNFTKYLMFYAPACIDSVIFHELCHTVHHDHSDRFYRLLTEVCPDYHSLRERMIGLPFSTVYLERLVEK